MKLSDLSEPDRRTIHLRGGSGGFKPESDAEAMERRQALADGASAILEFWMVEDDPGAIEFRRQYESWGHLITRGGDGPIKV